MTPSKRNMAAIGKGVSDEDYWSSSRAANIKAKGVNIFDDSLDLESAKSLVRSRLFADDDDDGDAVLGDDFVSVPSSDSRVEYTKSARYRPQRPPTAPGVVATKELRSSSVASSDSSYQYMPSAEPSIDDIVKSAPLRQPTLTEVSKLEAQVHQLNLQLEASRKEKFAKIPAKETVSRIIFGLPYSLELYKSREDKLTLLDEAIRMYDGNAITAAVLFLRDTLKKSLFHHELIQRPMAIEHFLCYLRQHADWQELVDLLGMLGRSEEAAMIKYRQAVSVKQAEVKIKNLRTCYTTHFQTDPALAHDSSIIQEQISLLETQLPVEDSDGKAAQMGDAKFRELPRAASIIGQPVITTLYYCCLYHYGLAENSFASPALLRKTHRLTDKQFVWTALRARARVRNWNDIEGLFKSKNWFGGTKMKAVVGFDKVVILLHKMSAPREILNKYCSLIDDTDRRLEVASKHNCPETIIETYKAMKDRQSLQQFYEKLKPNSQEWYYAKDTLNASTIKWKN